MQPSVAQSCRWPAWAVESAGLGTDQLWVVRPWSGDPVGGGLRVRLLG